MSLISFSPSSSSSSQSLFSKSIVISLPTLILILSSFFIFFIFLISSLPCPTRTTISLYGSSDLHQKEEEEVGVSATLEDITWVKEQVQINGLHLLENDPRKGINPRTREEQLRDLLEYKGISHYEGDEAYNHTILPCPGELLVEEHHSYYGEPWAGGRDVFEFLAMTTRLKSNSRVLEIGCGTLRVGLHFIRFLKPQRYHCLEKDERSLMAALRYELPSQGLLRKRPIIVRGENMDFSRFPKVTYDLIYSSAVFLHMPTNLVWTGLERLVNKLKIDGRMFVSHNIKFCTRVGGDECKRKLKALGLEYMGQYTHDSVLFNHYEIWHEFRRTN